MSLVKSTATIGLFTLLSRVLGFIRDITIASGIGASFLSDAFFVAFRIPNYLRRLFAEGAFNAAFVPQFVGTLDADGPEKAREFAGEAMSFLLLILLIVTGLFIIFMPWLMVVLAPGFADDPAKFDLTVLLTRITMPYIIFISLVSLLGGVLNSRNKFGAVAATPVLMNLCLIIIPTLIAPWTPTLAHGLAWAVMISGIVQWLWLVWFCRKEKLLPTLAIPRLTAQVRTLLKRIAPVALGAGVAQVNLFIDTIIATQFDSGVSYLYYADRINELPLAVIGIAVGTALLPLLSRQIREGKQQEAHHSQNRAIELALFLSLPAAAALMVIAAPVIHVMFERGAFGPAETVATYHALIAFAFGLPAFVLAKILAPGFYANHDTNTPFKIAITCILINLTFNLILMFPLKHVGMALATSIAGWANVVLMVRALKKRSWLTIERRLVVQSVRILACCGAMVLVLYGLSYVTAPYLARGEIVRFTALFAQCAVGLAAYLLAALALDVAGAKARLRGYFKKP